MRRLIAAVALALACASPGMPPGGPPDVAAPEIVEIVPDSGKTGVTPKEVLFRFDEVVAERPPGATSLADLFLISPRDGTPDVSWHRDVISVRPQHGWRKNTAYTITMLRGIADIRGNVRNSGAATFFSTGANIPQTHLAGRVFDWAANNVAPGALVEAFIRPDTLHSYIAAVDSNGAFALERVNPGQYTVRAFIDRNRNKGLDPGEPFDTVTVSLTDSVSRDLFVFVHDTVPPRIRDVSMSDSLTLTVDFDKPVDPTQALTAANFSLRAKDSTVVPIVSAGATKRDSTRARSDTSNTLRPATPTNLPTTPAATGRGPAPARRDTTHAVKVVMPRPAPITSATIKLERPLAPKTTYRVRAVGIRGLLGVTGDSERTYTTPAPPPPPKPMTTMPAASSTPASPPPQKH